MHVFCLTKLTPRLRVKVFLIPIDRKETHQKTDFFFSPESIISTIDAILRSNTSMSGSEGVVHVAFLPSAGMGLLNPCLRIEALFLCYGCKVTLITPKPTVSIAESNLISRFCSSFPHQVTQLDLNLITLKSNHS